MGAAVTGLTSGNTKAGRYQSYATRVHLSGVAEEGTLAAAHFWGKRDSGTARNAQAASEVKRKKRRR